MIAEDDGLHPSAAAGILPEMVESAEQSQAEDCEETGRIRAT